MNKLSDELSKLIALKKKFNFDIFLNLEDLSF